MAPRVPAQPPNPAEPFLTGADPSERETPPEEEAFSEIERLQSDAGPESGYQVAVYRKSSDGLRYNYIRRLPLVGFDIDKLPESYGGGQYLLRVNNERNRIVKTIRVAFDPAVHSAAPPAAAPAGASATPGSDFHALLLELTRQREQDRRDHQTFLQTMLTALLTTRGQSNTPTVAELVDAQLKMRELGGPPQKTDSEVILSALRLGLETAAGRVPGEDEGGDVLTKLVDKIGIPLVEAISRRSSNAPPHRAALPASAPGAGAPARAAGAGTLPPELEPFAFMRQYSPHLLTWAKGNFDPSRAAAVIYNLVDDATLPVLEAFLAKPAPERFSILVQLDPRLQAYQDYLERITTALQHEIELDAADEESPGGEDPDPVA